MLSIKSVAKAWSNDRFLLGKNVVRIFGVFGRFLTLAGLKVTELQKKLTAVTERYGVSSVVVNVVSHGQTVVLTTDHDGVVPLVVSVVKSPLGDDHLTTTTPWCDLTLKLLRAVKHFQTLNGLNRL